ncbi:MAG: glycosyltransferase [Leptospirillia bacterium]
MLVTLHAGFATLIPWLNLFILSYYIAVNGVYFALLFVSAIATERHRRSLRFGAFTHLASLPTTPPVTVIVPAYNEANNIVQTVQSLLALNYPSHEVIVVDDGSEDATLRYLIEAFSLHEVDLIYRPLIPTEPVKRFFVSPEIPGLTVVTKDNSGKSDSLNVGINLSRSPYFCSVDADSVLERNALLRLMGPIISAPDEIIATGGIVRVANGCTFQDGQIQEVRLPRNFLGRMQVVEYLRCFLFGRTGWSSIGALMILSGTFSMFKKSVVVEVGGYDTRTVAEDMEMVLRLHRRMQGSQENYRITFIADPICWTQVPTNLAALGAQRRRWHRGLGEAVLTHLPMLGRPRYGTVGMIGVPYQFVELFGPLVELFGYLVVGLSAVLGVLSTDFLLLYITLSVLTGVFLSVGAVLLEELTERRYPGWSHLMTLILFAILENFGYRQLNVFWRVRGLIQLATFRRKWEVVESEAFRPHAEPQGGGGG